MKTLELRNKMEVVANELGVNFELVEKAEAKAFAKNSTEPYNVIARNTKEWASAIYNERDIAGTVVMANKIEFDKNGYATITLETLAKGPLAKCAELYDGPVIKEGIPMGEKYRGTNDLLVAGTAENSNVGKLIKRNGLAVQYKVIRGLGKPRKTNVIEQVYTINVDRKGTISLSPRAKVKGVKRESVYGDDAVALLEECTVYRIQSSSQSQERKVEMILSSWDAEYALAVKFALSGRFLTELFYKHNGKINFDAAAKEWFKRDALIGSTMIPFGEISKEYGTGMIVTFGEFTGNETDVVEIEEANRIGYMQDNSSDKFKKANNGTKDGIAFARKSFVSMASHREYGISVAPNLLNVDLQMRVTGAGLKSFVELKEDEVFDKIAENIMKDGVEVSIEEALRRLDEARTTGKKVKFADNEYVILGDRSNICMIGDDNASKYLAFDGKYRVMLLDVPQINRKEINLSWQAFNKIAGFASEETMNYLVDKFGFDFADKMRRTLVETEPTLIGNASTVALSLNRKAKNVYDNMLALVKDSTQELASKVEGCKVSVPGIFVRAAFESSDMLVSGLNLLKADSYYAEVYCPALKDGEEVLGLKFPCPTKDEFQVYKNVGYKTMCSRIDMLVKAGKIKGYQAKLLKANFRGYGDATLVIVQEDSLKHKQAGMDTDYDGLQLIRDEKIVADAVADYKAKGYCGETIVIAKMK